MGYFTIILETPNKLSTPPTPSSMFIGHTSKGHEIWQTRPIHSLPDFLLLVASLKSQRRSNIVIHNYDVASRTITLRIDQD